MNRVASRPESRTSTRRRAALAAGRAPARSRAVLILLAASAVLGARPSALGPAGRRPQGRRASTRTSTPRSP